MYSICAHIMLEAHFPNVRVFNAQDGATKASQVGSFALAFCSMQKSTSDGLDRWFATVFGHVLRAGPKRSKRMLHDAFHEELKDIGLPRWAELLHTDSNCFLVVLNKRAWRHPVFVFDAHVEAEGVAIIAGHRDGISVDGDGR